MANFDSLVNGWQNITNSDNQKHNNSNYFQSDSDSNQDNNIYGSPKKISRNPKWDQYEQSIKPGINQYLKDLGLNKDYDTITLAEIQYNPKVDRTLIEQIKQRDSNRNPFMPKN
ncbi:MAG TPA: hypothetical protein V6C58_26770 [Allocoleopsis sp.]